MFKPEDLPFPKAFIIDDEMDICFLLTTLLKQKKVSTQCAGTLKEAETALHNNNPEIIFLDNHLPDGEGINYIRELKKAHPLTKIIMLTADDNQANQDKAMAEGADYFMGKPFSPEMINKIIDRFMA